MNTNLKATRITLERITVTTVRRGNALPVYCDRCRKEIEADGSVPESSVTKLLADDVERSNNEAKSK